MLFVCYPKCSTCMKAKKWLEEKEIEFEQRDIKEEKPAEFDTNRIGCVAKIDSTNSSFCQQTVLVSLLAGNKGISHPV